MLSSCLFVCPSQVRSSTKTAEARIMQITSYDNPGTLVYLHQRSRQRSDVVTHLELTSGQFHPILKQSVISPLLKKSTLDNDELSNYHPISNLSVMSKIIESVVISLLIDHLTSSKLLNPHQSAYCKHHSTETALLYIHDHLINAIGSQKVSHLCLLDLSAAFDTIDHNILITRLSSWFGIHGSVLSCSSLTYHLAPFVWNVITTFLPFILPLVVFPKALFLALYSSSCTLPLSALLSLTFPSTTFTLMILSSSLFTHSTLTQAFLTFKMLFNTSLPGWLLIISLLTPLRLISCSSDSKTNLQNYTTLHSTPPTLLETLASSSTNILLSLTKL